MEAEPYGTGDGRSVGELTHTKKLFHWKYGMMAVAITPLPLLRGLL